MKCQYCERDLPLSKFPAASSPFWSDGYANICYECTPGIVDKNNLNQVDRWCQWINLAFFPNEWRKIVQREAEPFKAYVAAHKDLNYYKYDWSEQNKKLMNLAATGLVELEIEELAPHAMEKLKKIWGSETAEKDILLMEERYNASLNDYNVATDAQRDQLRKTARLSVIIDRQLEKGKVDKDMMSMYDKLLTSVTKTLETMEGEGISSISELVEFIERNGYQATFYDGVPRDEIDMIMNNIQEYLRDLVEGEVNLTELYEEKKRMLNKRKEESENLKKNVALDNEIEIEEDDEDDE